MKARVKFTRIKNVVVMEVLEMDERFRSTKLANEFIATNCYNISSSFSPEIIKYNEGTFRICLRGSTRVCDSLATTETFKDEKSAIDFILKAKAALKEWGEKWEGFKPLLDSSAPEVEIVEVV